MSSKERISTFFPIIGQFFALICLTSQAISVQGWFYKCNLDTNLCARATDSGYPTLEVCIFNCGESNVIWPKPAQSDIAKEVIQFSKEVQFANKGTDDAFKFLQSTIAYFNNHVWYNKVRDCSQNTNTVSVTLAPLSSDVLLNWDTDESYNLTISKRNDGVDVFITGPTVFGVRHGLETLLQLIILLPTDQSVCLQIPRKAVIIDGPAYKHRGLLLDSARNYLSPAVIKKNIDGLAASKMNVLHWHVTDTQSFPLEIPSLPNMTIYGAYSRDKVYNTSVVQELVEYAKLRGVRIVFEVDGPSHSGSGWEWGQEAGLGNLAVCLNAQPWRSFCIQPPCGQLNPANQRLYPVLEKIFRDIKQLGNVDVFHMGGDELFVGCWNATQEIIDYIGNKPRTEETFLNLWGEHQQSVLKAFDAAVGNSDSKIILWSSSLTNSTIIKSHLSPDRYTIQTWVPRNDTLPVELLNLGYKLIISTKNAWYLDHGFWGTTPFYNWQVVYDNTILEHDGVLGGEVCMWGELVDDNNVLARVWPRAAAAGERLWSNPKTKFAQAQYRFQLHRERLIDRGVHSEAITPAYCSQNEGECV